MIAPKTLTGALLVVPLLWGAPAVAQDDSFDAREAELRAEIQNMRIEAQQLREEARAIRAEAERMRDEALRERQEETVDGGERVSYGDVILVADGEQVREVVAFGNDVRIAGIVLGDATAMGGDVIVTETGRVRGDAVSFGGRVQVENGGEVTGDRVAIEMPGVSRAAHQVTGSSAAGSLGPVADQEGLFSMLYRRLILLLSFAGAGVLVVGLFPTRVGRIASTLEAHPLRSASVGLLASGFLGLFSLLFAVITLGLGLPVSMVVWGILGLAWLMGFVGLCQAIGDRLPFEQKPHGRWLAFLVGTILLTCLGSLPLVGWLVVGAASIVGIGAALSTRFGGR